MKRRPENQSAITLFCSTITATAPTPATPRPTPMPVGRVGKRAENRAKHHQSEAAAQHQPITELASQQADRERHERAQHHEGADQCSERRVVELEQPHQVGTERRDSLVLIAKADPGERDRGQDQRGPGEQHRMRRKGDRRSPLCHLDHRIRRERALPVGHGEHRVEVDRGQPRSRRMRRTRTAATACAPAP